ncbi:MAG: SufE family protein [Thermoleophilia bacterium]|jgi:cysteine desulfuration protein SufE|nr:SufE family protein [Thermoleophilia bacterium]
MRDQLHEIVEEFADAPRDLRLPLLLDYSKRVPPLPAALAGRRDLMDQVVECQTPFFVAVETDAEGRVHLHFDAPPEAPTTRGYAGVIYEGLEGATPDEVLSTPNDFYVAMGLDELITPLRLRGMGAILARVKRLVAAGAQGA